MARCIQQNYMQTGRHSRGVKKQPLRVLYATNMPGVLTEIGFLSNKEEAAYLKSEKGQTAIVDALYRAVQDYSAYVLKMRLANDASTEPQPAPKREEVQPTPAPQPETKQASAAQSQPETKLYDARLYGDVKSKEQPKAAPKEAQKPTPVTKQEEPSKPALTGGKKSSPAPVKTASTQPAKRYYTVQVLASKRELPLSSPEFKSYRNRVHQYQSEGVYRYKYGVGEYATRGEALKAAEAVRKSFAQAFVVAVENGRAVTPKK
ncbi:MAG: N-acetylmuramoyl-L-alanine amidase, partial [Alistipes sp.]|nr:N-acetylmuramoyl-L-alanine amidase [Alistipes sp.]